LWCRYGVQKQLTAEHASYARRHPDLRSLLSDFVQHLLIDKPTDVLDFCTQYFDAFSAAYSEYDVTRGSAAGSGIVGSGTGSDVLVPPDSSNTAMVSDDKAAD